MLKTETLELDGTTFEATQFTAMRGFMLLVRVFKQIGPAMGVLAGADQSASVDSLGPVLAGALASLDPVEASKLVLELLGSTSALMDNRKYDFVGNHASSNFDLVFSGKLNSMFKVVAMVLRLNFELFSGGSDAAPAPLPAAVPAS